MRNKRVGEWLVDTRRRVTGSQQSPDKQDTGLDAQLLLSSVLGKSRAWVIAHPDAEIDLEQDDRLEGLLEKLTAGVPLPYLLGHWEFYGLDFQVSPAALIPQ